MRFRKSHITDPGTGRPKPNPSWVEERINICLLWAFAIILIPSSLMSSIRVAHPRQAAIMATTGIVAMLIACFWQRSLARRKQTLRDALVVYEQGAQAALNAHFK